jgi:activator of HSP90 ATPase
VNPSSGFPKAIVHPQTKSTEASSTQTTTTSKTGKVAVNTTTVTASDEFRTTAGELYSTFTDPQRIAAFTRGPPRQFDGAQVGGKFAIFDGNVTGEFVTLNEPKQIVQKWRLAQWPEGHFSSLEINFDQNDIDGVTQMRVTWSGVPVGQEDVTKQNWDMYYVRSIKQTFGYVTSSLPLASLFPWIIGISLRFFPGHLCQSAALSIDPILLPNHLGRGTSY